MNVNLAPEVRGLVIYREPGLVVVNKPSGIAIHSPCKKSSIGLTELLKNDWPKIRPAHRIDEATTGLVLFADGHGSARFLCKQFAARTVIKRYMAVVSGEMPENLVISTPLSERSVELKSESDNTYPAITKVQRVAEVRKADGVYSLVRATPETGRFHQIRRHLAGNGTPIVGDALYSTGGERLMLHADSITFNSPSTKDRITLTAPLPAYFGEFMDQAG